MNEFQNGTVRVSNDIIDLLIAETALRQEGVHSVYGYRDKSIEKRRKDGIVAVVQGSDIQIAVSISIESDAHIQNTAQAVQEAIVREIRTMLGLNVQAVNVIVKSLHYAK